MRLCGCSPGHPAQDQRDGARQGVGRCVGRIGKGPAGRRPQGHTAGPAEQGGEDGEPNLLEGQDRIQHEMIVEGEFLIFKRIFGEHVMSLKWENII